MYPTRCVRGVTFGADFASAVLIGSRRKCSKEFTHVDLKRCRRIPVSRDRVSNLYALRFRCRSLSLEWGRDEFLVDSNYVSSNFVFMGPKATDNIKLDFDLQC